MIISTTWLADYVHLPASVDALVERLLMSGLNHEATWAVGGDTAVEIEVTSNRPDCLGHVGVAREVSVLFDQPLHLPDPRPATSTRPVAAGVVVENLFPAACPCYTARVIRGVRVGPSPEWLVARLATIGVASVNNVVDVTNYVMFECGQPLHAFDLARLRGGRIVIRPARADEPFTAINHKTYVLSPEMCVIADAERPVALAGVMGGADTEIGTGTVEVLLESAQFAPLPVRAAARGLVLSSASSYRFERGPDPAAVDWAGRRAAALILELAGGTLDEGVVVAGSLAGRQASIPLAPQRVRTVLGIDVPGERQHRILTGLGFVEEAQPGVWRAPSWRRDCWREIDLVEEVARIEGYHRVPEDAPIAARPVEWSDRERTIRRTGEVFVAAGFCEALTHSVVPAPLEATASPWGDAAPLAVAPPLVRGADRLRRSLLPSLVEARAANAAAGNADADLFEIARGYLARSGPADAPSPVDEPLLASFVTGGEYPRGRGVVDAVLAHLGLPDAECCIDYRPLTLDLFTPGRAAEVLLHRDGLPPLRIAVVGEIAAGIRERVAAAGPLVAGEIRIDRLEFTARRERPLVRPSDFPAVTRDINLVVAEDVPWSRIEAAIRGAAGATLEACAVSQIWQDAERLGVGRKSVVVSLVLRSGSGTLSGDDAARLVAGVVEACRRDVQAEMR